MARVARGLLFFTVVGGDLDNRVSVAVGEAMRQLELSEGGFKVEILTMPSSSVQIKISGYVSIAMFDAPLRRRKCWLPRPPEAEEVPTWARRSTARIAIGGRSFSRTERVAGELTNVCLRAVQSGSLPWWMCSGRQSGNSGRMTNTSPPFRRPHFSSHLKHRRSHLEI